MMPECLILNDGKIYLFELSNNIECLKRNFKFYKRINVILYVSWRFNCNIRSDCTSRWGTVLAWVVMKHLFRHVFILRAISLYFYISIRTWWYTNLLPYFIVHWPLVVVVVVEYTNLLIIFYCPLTFGCGGGGGGWGAISNTIAYSFMGNSTRRATVSNHCRTLLMTSPHWFRWWLGAVRQQTINRTNIE